MSLDKLPEEWRQASILTSITHTGLISDGDWVESKDQDPNGSVRLIQLADIGDGYFKNKSERFMTPEKVRSLNCTYLIPGDVLVARMPEPLGRACIFPDIGKNAVTVVDICLLRTSTCSAINNNILVHWLNSPAIRSIIEQNSSGSTRKRITRKKLEQFIIPLPPLAEQKIIAEKLDTLLAQVDSTKARLEQIPQILKRFRQAVLGTALSGLLISINKRQHHPLCSEWQWPDIPSTWRVHKYSELVDSRLGKMLDKSKNIGSATKYLGNINVRWFDFDLENLQKILVSDVERKELSLSSGDVLICEGGEPGRCAIWNELQETPIIFQKALHRARVKEKIIPEWLAYNLKNDSNNLSLSQLFTGTTIKHLTGKALANYPIRVPPLVEQQEIIRRVEQLFAYADTIEKQVNNALAHVNSLTQSILAKAFRGELTAQWRAENPDLISGENSAAALLEKIKAERAASGSKKVSRKKK